MITSLYTFVKLPTDPGGCEVDRRWWLRALLCSARGIALGCCSRQSEACVDEITELEIFRSEGAAR